MDMITRIHGLQENMNSKVRDYINENHMISPGDWVVVGVSGGADSVCLLLLLWQLQKEIPFYVSVVHINHGIRGEDAQLDSDYVRKLCAGFGYDFTLETVDVPELAAKKHVSEEEAGREARYLAFNKKVKQIHEYGKDISQIKIAVAHHQDDQAETVLFRLARGTGLSGLCGIRPINGHIIRPMLALTKQEIYDILKENDLSFRVDATNMEDSYARNRIRNKVLPYLEENICHNAGAHIAETAAMLAEAETYISKEAGKKLLTCVIRDDNGYRYSIQKELFLQEDIILQKYMILKIFHELTEGRKDITQVHVQDVLNLFQKQVGRKIDLPYDLCARVCYGKVIHLYQTKLHIRKRK